MLKSLTPLLTFKVSSLDIFSVMLSHVVRLNYLFYSSTFLLLVVLTTTSLEIIRPQTSRISTVITSSVNTLHPKCGRFLRLFEELKGMLSFGIKVQLQRHIDKSYAKRCSNFFVVAM